MIHGIPEELRQKIAGESAMYCGCGIPAVMQKKEISIGFMGGSVTCGFAGDRFRETAYPQMAAAALREQGYTVTDRMCAEPGMDSMIGNLVCGNEILAAKPDIVFLEFSINEWTQRPHMMSFESLVRKLKTQPEPPVVALLLIRSTGGYSCESFMVPMAEHYGIPYINVRTGLNAALERGELQWEDYADGESHPTPDGHRLLAECILRLLACTDSEPERSLPEPWLDAPFAAMRLVVPEEMEPREYRRLPHVLYISGKPWEYHCRCARAVLFYEVQNNPDFGAVRITVDGKPLREPVVDSNSIYGWGNPLYSIILNTETAADHIFRLEPLNGTFRVVGLGIV